MKVFIRALCITGLAALLAACGVRSAYNNLDWLAMRWLNKQVSLNAEQDIATRSAIEEQLAWHCSSELPAYIEFLERLDRDIANDQITIDRLQTHSERLTEFGERVLENAQPTLIDLLASLDDEQIDELLDGLDERNEELVEESIEASAEERQARRVESMERGMRRFVGGLSNEQRARLEQWAAELRPTAEFDLARRQAWKERFEQALAMRQDRAVFDAQMTALLQPEPTENETHKAHSLHNRARTLEALVDLHRMSDPRQVNRLRSRLNRLARDFEQLSCNQQA